MYIYKFRVVRNPEKIKKKCCDLQVSRKPMFIRVNNAKSVEKYHFIVMFTVMNIIKLCTLHIQTGSAVYKIFLFI